MEIRAKLSLAVDGFKSGLNSAKKDLQDFGKDGSKVNSKFAKDLRSSFDNLGPNLKREGRGIRREFDGISRDAKNAFRNGLTNVWKPLESGFNKATAKLALNSSLIGGYFRNMTKSAKDHSKAVDGYIKANADARIRGAQRAFDFESRVAQSNRRIDKQRMRDQFGAVDNRAAHSTWVAKNPLPTKTAISRKPEIDYTKWWEQELKKRLFASLKSEAIYQGRRIASNAKRIASDVSTSAKSFAAQVKYNGQLAGMWTKEHAQRIAGNARAAGQITALWVKQNAQRLASDIKYRRDYKALERESLAKAFNSPQFEKSMAATRYALYDIGHRFLAFGGVVAGAFGEAVKAAANFESSFTSVERTTGVVLGKSGGQAELLKKQLIELSTTMPVSFEQIARITTLGAQMGISADSVDNFAVTVSKFSAITGISVDTAAQSFGRLGQLLKINANEFENLSSAITYTGVNSVATDQEILSMSESIAAAATQAGISADEVIGLSAALASLKIRPEEARGVLARLFREIDLQVSKSGTELDDFGKVLGVTSDAAAQLWKQDPSGFFAKFLDGAQATGKLNETLVALGITNTREMNVIQRLSQNTGLLASTMADAEKQYLLGTYSSEAYGLVVDDLNSKMTMFQNSLQAMQASFGDVMSGGLKIVIDGLTALVKMFTGMPTGIKVVIAAIAALSAITAVLFGGLALGIAGMLAMKLALKNLSAEGIQATISFGTFRALLSTMIPTTGMAAGALKMLGISAQTSAVGVKTLGMSMRSMLVASGIGIAIVALSMALDAFGNAANGANADALAAGNAMLEAGGGAEKFGKALAADNQAIKNGAQSLGKLTLAYSDTAKAQMSSENQALATAKATEATVSAYQDQATQSGKLADAYDVITQSNDAYNQSLGVTKGLTNDVTNNMGAQAAAFYVEALAKYKGPNGDQKTFFENLFDPNNAEVKATLEAMGLSAGSLVAAGMAETGGATKYIDKLQTELNNASRAITGLDYNDAQNKLQAYGKANKWTAEQIAAVSKQIQSNGAGLKGFDVTYDPSLPDWLYSAAKGVDGLGTAAAQSQAVIDASKKAMTDLGYSANVADDLVGGLAETLKGYMDAAFSGEAATNSAADAFQTYANGVTDVTDGLSGARQDIANWVGYMNAAREAAIQNGEGFTGSVTRIMTGIQALANAGKDVKKPFEDMRKYLVTAAKGDGFAELGDKIATATDPSQLAGIIQAFIDVQDATTAAGKKAIAYGIALKGALSVNPELLKILTAAFDNTTKSTTKAKTALEKLQEALDKVFKTVNNKINLEASLDSLGKSLRDGAGSFSVYTDAGRSNMTNLRDVIDNLATNSNGNMQTMANSLASLKKAMLDAGVNSVIAMNMIDMALKATGKTGTINTNDVKKMFNGLTLTVTEEAKKTKKTLKDWVSDIQSVLSEAFQNRYASTEALDNITSAWSEMGKAASDAANQINEANASINQLKADKNILEYQLKIAIKYGDTLRADAIRAQIAEKAQSTAEAQQKIAEAQAAMSTALTGTSDAAIRNREKLRSLVQQYNEYLLSLARTGTSNADLKKKATELAKEFMTQGKNMGFAEADLKSYTSAFENDFATVINNLPRDVTLTLASTDPVLTAIADFVTKANAELAKITVIGLDGKTITGSDSAGVQTPLVSQKPVPTAAQIAEYRKDKASILAYKKKTQTSAVKAYIKARQSEVAAFETKFGKGYKDGGMVFGPGNSTSDSIPAMLSRGEFVVQASAVNKYGPDFLNALNQMRVSMPASSALASSSGSSSSVVYLSPEDRQLLRAAIDRPVNLYTENTKIAQSANAGNVVLAQRGSK